MWGRQIRDQLERTLGAEPAPAPEPGSEGPDGFTPFEQWEGRWARAEEERVARWLVDKVGPSTRSVLEQQVDRLAVAFDHERYHSDDRRVQPVPADEETGGLELPAASAGADPATAAAFDMATVEVMERQFEMEIDLRDHHEPTERLTDAAGGDEYAAGNGEEYAAGNGAEYAAGNGADDAAGNGFGAHLLREELETEARLREAELDALQAEVTVLDEQRRQLAAAVDAERAVLAALEDQRRQLTAAVEAERAVLATLEDERREVEVAAEAERAEMAEERRRMITAFQADQLEVDRVRRFQIETRVRLEAEVADLEEQRRRMADTMAEAASAADRARQEERAALARIEAAQEEARRVEAERFELWVALDAEIAALKQRRQQLVGPDEAHQT